jgi:hypothetical protein
LRIAAAPLHFGDRRIPHSAFEGAVAMDSTRFTDEQFASTAGSGIPGAGGAAPEPGVEAAKRLVNDLKALSSYASHYAMAKADSVKLSVRQAAIATVLGLVAALVLSAVLVVAVVQLLTGAASGLATLLGDRLWAANLIVGASVLVLMALAVWLGLSWMKKSSLRSTVEKYEQRKQEQRAQFGRDVSQRAAGP